MVETIISFDAEARLSEPAMRRNSAFIGMRSLTASFSMNNFNVGHQTHLLPSRMKRTGQFAWLSTKGRMSSSYHFPFPTTPHAVMQSENRIVSALEKCETFRKFGSKCEDQQVADIDIVYCPLTLTPTVPAGASRT